YHVCFPLLVLFRKQRTTEKRFHSQQRKERRRNCGRIHLLRLSVPAYGEVAVAEDRHLVENVVLVLPIDEVRRRNGKRRNAGETRGRRHMPHTHQAIRVLIGEGL